MIRNKIFTTTGFCLLPIVLGVRLFLVLPDKINTNLTLPNNTPNMELNKIIVILLPILYASIHFFYFIFRDKIVNGGKDIIVNNQWLIPLFSQIISIIILINSLQYNDVTTIYLFLFVAIGFIFIKVGADYKYEDTKK